MSFAGSDMLVIFLLGKYSKLSGKEIFEKSKKERECLEFAPKHSSTIYEAIVRLSKNGYIKKVEEKEVRGTLEKFWSLTSLGQKRYLKIRYALPIIDLIPDFERFPCRECKKRDVEECWDSWFNELNEISRKQFKKTLRYERKKLKELLDNQALIELVYWLRMLEIPEKILKDKFKLIIEILQPENLSMQNRKGILKG